MPKEVMVTHRDVFGPESGAAAAIEVRWGRNEHVELGARVVYAVDPSVDYIPTKAEGGGRWPADESISGLYTSLTRPQINDLIRNLRRARDQAFGRDE